MQDISRRQRIPLLPVNSTEPVADQVSSLLGHRVAVRRHRWRA
jgi:hypothetical protein